jgi:manganese/iron transport system substrate-binding protein
VRTILILADFPPIQPGFNLVLTMTITPKVSGLGGLVALVLIGCSSPSMPPQTSPTTSASLKVVATTNVICDLTRQIAETTVELICLVQPGQDPHAYQPTPADRKAIETANLVLYGGYGLEPNLIKLVKASTAPAAKVAVHELAVPTPLKGSHDHHEAGEHKDGDHKDGDHKDGDHKDGDHKDGDHKDGDHKDGDHKDGDHKDGEPSPQAAGEAGEEADPHVWHDAKNGIKMTEAIAAALSKASPANGDRYRKNAAAITAKLSQLDGWVKQQIATIPAENRKLITTHEALGYYAQAYGIPLEGALQGISSDEQPTPTQVKTLVQEIKASQVPTVFAERSVNPALIETVAREAGVKVADQSLYADGLGEAGSGAETYDQMLVANTRAIVQGLGGKFQSP